MQTTFLSATLLLLLTTDPLGNIPLFISTLEQVKPERRFFIITREVLIAFAGGDAAERRDLLHPGHAGALSRFSAAG
jgi:hypothetical protein